MEIDFPGILCNALISQSEGSTSNEQLSIMDQFEESMCIGVPCSKPMDKATMISMSDTFVIKAADASPKATSKPRRNPRRNAKRNAQRKAKRMAKRDEPVAQAAEQAQPAQQAWEKGPVALRVDSQTTGERKNWFFATAEVDRRTRSRNNVDCNSVENATEQDVRDWLVQYNKTASVPLEIIVLEPVTDLNFVFEYLSRAMQELKLRSLEITSDTVVDLAQHAVAMERKIAAHK